MKIRFPLPEEDQAGGILAETLWAVSLGGGRYRLEYGDDVEKLWSMEEAHYGRR